MYKDIIKIIICLIWLLQIVKADSEVEIMAVSGDVKIRYGLEENWSKADIGILLKDIDTILTGENGEVVLQLTGNIALNQVNGQIILRKVTANLCVELTNGNIYGDIALLYMGSCSVKTVNGQIDLHIPQNTSADFVASVVNGGITVHNLILHEIESSPKYLKGRLGDGAGTIELQVVNGTIYVTGR